MFKIFIFWGNRRESAPTRQGAVRKALHTFQMSVFQKNVASPSNTYVDSNLLKSGVIIWGIMPHVNRMGLKGADPAIKLCHFLKDTGGAFFLTLSHHSATRVAQRKPSMQSFDLLPKGRFDRFG